MDVCRTCLSYDHLIPLFTEYDTNNFTNSQLILTTGVNIMPKDGMSQLICTPCINLIKNALKLREQSLKADETLKERLTKKQVFVDIKIESNDSLTENRDIDTKKCINNKQNVYDNDSFDFSDDDYLKDDTKLNKCTNKMIKSDDSDFNFDSFSIKHSVKKNNKTTKKIKRKKRVLTRDKKIGGNPKHSIQNKYNQRVNAKKVDIKLLSIEDLESSDSETEIRQVRIEDFESSDSFDQDDLNLITDRERCGRLDMYGEKDMVIDDNYLEYLKHVKEEEQRQKERRLLLSKQQQQKYLALAVTPYSCKGPIQCKVCHKQIRNLQNFKAHAKTHFDPQFSCESCGKKFQCNSHLRYHEQRMHGRPKRLACAKCPFRAVDRPTLRNHERAAHTGERPYVCAECGRAFRMRANLVQHLRKHFGVKNVQCEMCPAMFRTRSELWGHQTKVHLMDFTYYCYLCPESYKGSIAVKKHIQNAHGIPESQQMKVKCVKTRKIRTNEPSTMAHNSAVI